MGKKNTGKEYEKLTQVIFDQIINQKTAETIEVQQDIILQGRTTAHQIDVYWEFDLGGIQYRTVIQAKDWKNKVKQEQMLAFKAILDDLPAGTMGVFVSRNGFQSGAVNVAEKHGIKIYELREPVDKDWEGTITKVDIEMNFRSPKVKDLQLVVDENWMLKEYGGKVGEEGVVSGLDMLVEEDGTEICMLGDIVKKILQKASDEITYMEYNFEEDTFLVINEKKVKLKGINGLFGYNVLKNTIKIDIESVVGMILKDLISGDIKRFDKQNKLLGTEE